MNEEDTENLCEDILTDVKSIIRENHTDISMDKDRYQKEINNALKSVIEELKSYLISC